MAKQEFPIPPGKRVTAAVLDQGPAVLASATRPDEKQAMLDAASPPANGMGAMVAAMENMQLEKPDDILKHVCPMCGWDQRVHNVVEPTEQEKEEFTLAALGNTRFTRSYPCMGGRMKITMRSRTFAETESVVDHVDRWRKKENILAANAIILKTYVFQAIFSLAKIEIEGQEPKTFPVVKPDLTAGPMNGLSELEIAEQKLKGEFSDITYQLVQNASRHFDQMVAHMTLRAHDANFWKRIATLA